MNSTQVLKALDILIAGIGLLQSAGVNYRQVIDAQERAEAEGRELNAGERQEFLDQAKAAIDKL